MPTYLAVVHTSNKSFPTAELAILRKLLESPRFAAASLQEANNGPRLFVRCEAPALAHDISMEILRSARMHARQKTTAGAWCLGLASGAAVARDGLDTTLVTAAELADAASPGQLLILRETFESLDRSRQRRYLGALAIDSGYPAYASLPENHKECFCVLPIGPEDSDIRRQSDLVFERVIQPACFRMSMLALKPQEQTGDNILHDVTQSLTAADLVVAYVGAPPWNANVMLEIGYRLSIGRPLVIVAPASEGLPFDLKHHRTVELARPPLEIPEEEWAELVEALVAVATDRMGADRGTNDLHPTLTMFIDKKGNPPKHEVVDVSEETALLFHRNRHDLIGMPPTELMETVLRGFMIHEHIGEYYEAFAKEQTELYAKCTAPLAPGEARRPVRATVPMVFVNHPNPRYNLRAWLPVILRYEDFPEHARYRVVYIDASRAVRPHHGHYRTGPPGPVDHLLFSRYAEVYDRVLPLLPNYCRAVDRHVELLAKRSHVLDLGAGTGNVAIALLKAGATVTAIDVNERMLNELSAKLDALQEPDRQRLTSRRGDCQDLDFLADDSFDAVNVLLVLFSLEDPLQALEEAARVLKPGGILVVTEPRRTFDMEGALRDAEQWLTSERHLPRLASSWQVVRTVNAAFGPTLSAQGTAEVVVDWLRQHSWPLDSEESYGGLCWTIHARKPRSWR